ncbi:nuclease-related domain-containing protein [Rathayibacter iranicus]|uniref:Nuclease-like protein n=1 Tax=Rathayibacter iranicus NCPPB 2253 = VKM Ac-1602 TaxID=1328868 RepID=A0ABX5LC23_9MICO|nr:nuclease-related domain-containing protein [Rathayibacter iranicus]MWV32480.1 NERD domain-containing protein [Rathayibacter iranicus NCPPB 2253 = VKM Ac-1602]PWJ61217.1 nuclease-like protein [Rathayibacter iranicus] [Rathayibacter iranicus NCPPB 2253 = VKM Ac-1602]
MTAPGQILGRTGASLTNASWAANASVAKVGQRGEERTARILNALALRPGGPTVIHDLRIPLPSFTANIDHVVISGRTVTILDTKVWAPGFYWTFDGVTRRGLELFAPADKRTVPAAVSALNRHLERDAPRARLGAPTLIIWPSNDRTAQRLWFLRSPGARAVSGPAFERSVTRIVGSRPADPHVVTALVPLINS